MRKTKERKRVKNKIYGAVQLQSQHTSLHSLAILLEMIELSFVKYFFNKNFIYDNQGKEIFYNFDEYTENISFDTDSFKKMKTLVNMTKKATKLLKETFISLNKTIDLNHSLKMIELDFKSIKNNSTETIEINNIEKACHDFIVRVNVYTELFYKSLVISKEKHLNKKEYNYLFNFYTRLKNIDNFLLSEIRSDYGFRDTVK